MPTVDPSQNIWRRTRRCICRFAAAYIALLAISYALLLHAQSIFNSEAIYWEEAAGIAIDVNNSKALQNAIDIIGERPSPEGCAEESSTKSLALWTVFETWVKLRKDTNTMKICTVNQLEWTHVVIDTASRVTVND